MYIIRKKLYVTKEQKHELNKMFFIAYKIYVICVKYAKKQYRLLKSNKRYIYLLYLYKLYKERKEDFPYKDELNNLIIDYKLTKSDLEKYLKVQSKKYKHILTSTQVQRIADNVSQAVDKCLYNNGKNINIKPFYQFNELSQKGFNGFKYDGYNISFMNEIFSLRYNIDKDNLNKISTLSIQRIEFDSGYEYYIKFFIKDSAPIRIVKGIEEVGIDPGVSQEAICLDSNCILEELAPRCKEYNKDIINLQKRLDTSLRATNKDCYNVDGTYKKGSKLKYNKKQKYLKRKIRVLHRKKHDYTSCLHKNLANRIVSNANIIKIEKMDFKALVKRSKNLERSDKESVIKNKDGTEKVIHKYKKKKRFGKSINDRSPGLFIKILKDKSKALGIKVKEIDNKVAASQYNHVTNNYEKHKLSERTKLIDDKLVQRDLYSAFLIKNTGNKKINRSKCKKDFNKFLENQEKEIARIKDAGIKNKNFGI